MRLSRGNESVVVVLKTKTSKNGGVLALLIYALHCYIAFLTFKLMQAERKRERILKCWCCIALFRGLARKFPKLCALETVFAIVVTQHAHLLVYVPEHTNDVVSLVVNFAFEKIVGQICEISNRITLRVFSLTIDACRIVLISGVSRFLERLHPQQLDELKKTLQDSLSIIDQELHFRNKSTHRTSSTQTGNEREISGDQSRKEPKVFEEMEEMEAKVGEEEEEEEKELIESPML